MYVYLHIPKTAGTSFRFILENTFGIRHCHSGHARTHLFEQRDLDFARRFFPGLRSIAGHNLADPLRLAIADPFYMTVLRDPVTRAVSDYQDGVLRAGSRRSFEQVLREQPRAANLQVKKIAGEANLDKAIANLEKFHFVGLTEKFDLGLHALSRLTPTPLNLNYRRYVIAKDDRIKKQLLADPAMLAIAREVNALDVALYEHACREIFPRLCQKAGIDPDASLPAFDTCKHDWQFNYRIGRVYNKIYRTLHFRSRKLSGVA